jgi:hypothetical protein
MATGEKRPQSFFLGMLVAVFLALCFWLGLAFGFF